MGAGGVEAAASSSEMIVIDEVGPMELVSPEFRRAVKKCIDSGKPMLAVVHERLDDDLLNELRSKAGAQFTLSTENREATAQEIGDSLLDALGGSHAN